MSQIHGGVQGYSIMRVINPDGTLESETQAGRTTTYQYDDLGRVTHMQGPGGPALSTPVVITYDSATGRTITTTRGAPVLEEFLDGFGRVRETRNSLDVRTRTEYDAWGVSPIKAIPSSRTSASGTSEPPTCTTASIG